MVSPGPVETKLHKLKADHGKDLVIRDIRVTVMFDPPVIQS